MMAFSLSTVTSLVAPDASAQSANPYQGSTYYNQTYQHGLALPHVPLPSGSDEFRAADGTACRSNTASNDAYLDVGAIGTQDADGSSIGGTFYGRIIMPLGPKPKRLDCSHLYTLEIERLRHELQLVRMGAGGKFAPASDAVASPALATPGKTAKSSWQTEGWSTPGGKASKRGKSEGSANSATPSAAVDDRATVVPVKAVGGASRLGGPSAPRASLPAARASTAPGNPGVRPSLPSLDVATGWVTVVERSR